jgi:hypothetical protein
VCVWVCECGCVKPSRTVIANHCLLEGGKAGQERSEDEESKDVAGCGTATFIIIHDQRRVRPGCPLRCRLIFWVSNKAMNGQLGPWHMGY